MIFSGPGAAAGGKGFQQSDALLTLLFAAFEKPEVQVRLRWEFYAPVALWDNRSSVPAWAPLTSTGMTAVSKVR